MAVFYVWIGAFYGLFLQWEFVLDAVNVHNLLFPFVLIAPHFCWFFGFVSLWGMVVSILHTLALMTFFSTMYLFYLQVNSIYKGQTQYEIKHSIKDYNLSTEENIVDVLGTKWFLVWISPHISSPLKGDGLNFILSKDYEMPKNI